MLRLLFLLLISATAQAQYFGGIKLPVSGDTRVRWATAEAGTIDSTLFIGTVAPGIGRAHEWNLVTSLQNYADEGDNVSLYAKADKYGKGPTFGAVIEVQDTVGSGAIWGLEVDVMGKPDAGQRNRYGIGLVVGRNGNRGEKAYVDHGIIVVPWEWRQDEAEVGVGVGVYTTCRYACLSIPAGQRMAWDGPEGEISQRFDPQTGYMEWLFRGKPVMQLQMETGALLVNGRQIN